jgi:hypothetical protein
VRHDPVSVLEHLVHDADADGVFGFPGIVPDEPGQQVRKDKQREERWRERQGDPCVHFSHLLLPPPK